MKRGWLLLVLLAVVTLAAPEATSQTLAPVTWIGLVNATANGNTLQNVGGPGSGGLSAQHLSSGNGFVQVTVVDSNMDYVLSLGTPGGGFVGTYALHFGLGVAEVRESSWTLRANTLINAGDTVGIGVTNGQVTYFKNGVTFYTSAIAPTYPLGVLASLWSFGAKVSNASLSTTFAMAPRRPATAFLPVPALARDAATNLVPW
jgi:hypothetical protein